MDKYVEFLKKTQTGVITDALTTLRVGGWMKGIHPTNPKMKVAGRAFTVQYDYLQEPFQYTPIFRLFEKCRPGDVMVIDAAKDDGAMLGEHVVHAASNLGLGGLVVDGIFRDIAAIAEMELPTFCTGYEALHCPPNFKPVAYNVPVVCGGLLVNPGDYIFGDLDGVIGMPPEAMDDIIYQAEKVIEIEEQLFKALNERCSMDEFARLGKEKMTLRPR